MTAWGDIIELTNRPPATSVVRTSTSNSAWTVTSTWPLATTSAPLRTALSDLHMR